MSSILNRPALSTVASGGGVTRTQSVTLSSGTGRKLVFCAVRTGETGTASIDSATFDGNACTSFYSRTSDGSPATRRRWFYYDIPDGLGAGNYNLVVTLSLDQSSLGFAIWVTQGDTAGAPQIGNGTNGAGVGTTVSASVPAQNTDVLLTLVVNEDQSVTYTTPPTSSEVTFANGSTSSGNATRFGKADASGDATETVTVTWTQNNTTGVKEADIVNTTPLVVGPTITVQPTADTGIISNGQSTTYTTTATGSTISALTWKEDGASIADGGIYDIVTTGIGTGSVTSTLTITRTDKTGTPFDIKATITDANGSTDTNTVTDTWWTGPVLTTFPATNGSGVSTATLTCDYVTGVGEAIEVAIVLPDGRLSVSTTTT